MILNFNHYKSVALPREHGAYGFTIEPLMLGLLTAYTSAGLLLALGTMLAFFAHQPVKILFGQNKDLRKTAGLFLVLYLTAALYFFVLFLKQTSFHSAAPFYSALILMAFYLILDLLHYSRRIFVEIMAPAAIGLIAVSIVLAAGWSDNKALGLGLLLAARFVPTPFYVRARLRLEKKQEPENGAALFSSGFSLVLIFLLSLMGITPWLGLTAVGVLTLRTFLGLSSLRKKSTVRAVGMREFFYGQVLVWFSAAGYWLGI